VAREPVLADAVRLHEFLGQNFARRNRRKPLVLGHGLRQLALVIADSVAPTPTSPAARAGKRGFASQGSDESRQCQRASERDVESSSDAALLPKNTVAASSDTIGLLRASSMAARSSSVMT